VFFFAGLRGNNFNRRFEISMNLLGGMM